MKSVTLLSIYLCISSIDCLNCSNVVVDGQYVGLRIYSNISAVDNWLDDYIQETWMFNALGEKWRFNVSVYDDKQGRDGSLDFEDTVSPIDKSVEQIFGVYYRYEEGKSNHLVSCSIIKSDGNNFRCVFLRVEDRIKQVMAKTQIKGVLNFTFNSVILKPIPSQEYYRQYESASYVLAIDRDNKTNRIKMTFTPENQIETEVCDQQCPHIPFIEQMDDKLFGQLDSAVEYITEYTYLNESKSFADYILLFNIDERPFYCFQPVKKPLSRQV